MLCQRCLDPVAVPLAIDVELELRTSLEEIESADDDVDRVPATRAMDVVALVEDEAILVLPMVPRHDACEIAAAAAAAPNQASPFAVLGKLKQGF